ncbi:P-loop containing nucleoside triphosphate hydrolase protein [Pyrenochaeta sp. MPI-SDFR-AT-0127]|nr:P-loop containing nucleoside triphosphate hydrolase protein [Pyrenochaeta sp. MPI-SDFR-AT-0127]
MASSMSFSGANSGFQLGNNTGSVHNTFNLPPERSGTPPRPTILIPFPRDPDFVERGAKLDEIKKRFATTGSRAALVGLGGVGKSQLAIEYAYRTRKQLPETWVLWVHASNAARFEQSFRDIADCVKILGRQDSQANIFKLVHDWLRDSKHRWFLILDNVDDASYLQPTDSNRSQPMDKSRTADRPLREYLPHCEHGSILITTRNKAAGLKLVETRDVIHVEPMDKMQALTLLEKKLGVQEDTDDTGDDAAELTAALEYMPLAIVQAASYILQRAPRCSVAQYLKDFKKSERKRSSLLTHEDSQLRRDWEAKNSILITWQISIEYIQQTRPSAADLLSLMSFFDRQGIPEALLHRRTAQGTDRQDQAEPEDKDSNSEEDIASQSSAADDDFERDIVVLRNFYLISIETSGTGFEMHALVQLATRKWLAANGTDERWRQQFVSNLNAEFPTGQYENWPICQALFAHVKAAVEYNLEKESSLLEWAKLLYHAAWYAVEIGNINDAITFAVKSLEVRKNVLGLEHGESLLSMAMAGLAYKLGGRWNEAEELEEQVLETRKKNLGIDHPDTLVSMNNLAVTYMNQGRWDVAEVLQVQVLESYKKKLGLEHPETLLSMGNLASIYWSQGRWDTAEELQVRTLETQKKKLGLDHPNTLICMGNLASTYMHQGRWNAAEELRVQLLETQKKKLGLDHPNTLICMGNLALIYGSQGRWDTAEKLQVQVLETHKKKLGLDHPDTLISMNNLSWTWRYLGRDSDAIKLMRQCVRLCQQILQANHPLLIDSSATLAEWETSQATVN